MSNYKGSFDANAKNSSWNNAFELISGNSTVLDVGCSNGEFGEALSLIKSCTVDGIEPDLGDFNLSKNKLNNAYNGFIEEAFADNFFKNTKYDYVVFLDVIEHLANPVEVLRKVKSILKPEGKIIYSIPNMSHVSVRLMLISGNFEYGETGLLDNTHLHFYTLPEINRVFNDAGYNLLDNNPVEIYYSSEMIADCLVKKGINTVSTEIIELLNTNNGHIYQYVGSAGISKSEGSKKKLGNRFFAMPDPSGYFSEWYDNRETNLLKQIKDDNEKISMISKELSLSQKLLDEKNKQLDHLNDMITKITHSKKYRLGMIAGRGLDSIRHPARTIRKIVRGNDLE